MRAMSQPARRAVLLLAAVLLCLPACSTVKERWAALELHEIAFSNLYLSVLDVLDAQGFPVQRRDPQAGTIESDWLYGTVVRQVYGPSRRKVFVEIVPSERVIDGYTVRIRVVEEIIRRAGTRASRVRESKDWEEWEDNFDDAEFLATKVRALLPDHVTSGAARLADQAP